MIEVKNLTKRYGQHVAVDNISFTVNDGEILGFLGPNGAGKTTTMNIITGYISYTEGEVNINGCDIVEQPEAAKKNIGYLPEQPPVYTEMLVDEYLNFAADLKKVPRRGRKNVLDEIKESVKITDMSKRMIKNLSKGYRQRVGLAQAMLGNPNIIIMDEPTVGLDPRQILEMRDVIKGLGKKHTIMLSSHILQEVSAVCDRVMIINKGKIVASDTIDKLTLSSGNKLVIRVKGNENDIKRALNDISTLKYVKIDGSKEKGTYDAVVTGDPDADIREAVFYGLARNNLPLLGMKNFSASLEDVFLKIITGEGGDN